MIQDFNHKGLELFYTTGSKAKIKPAHAKKIHSLLQALDGATKAEHVDLPGLELHSLTGNLNGFYSIKVNGNWRIIFKFKDTHAFFSVPDKKLKSPANTRFVIPEVSAP